MTQETGRMDIAEFLTARLDEDEQLAKHAEHLAREGGTRWTVGTTRYVEDYAFVSITTAPPNAVEVAGSGFDGTGGVHGLVYAEHIARWDAARVLAEAAAKRAIVKWHTGNVAEYTDGTEVRFCGICPHEIGWNGDLWASCRGLRLLAAPYADHSDYDPAWRIET